MVSRLSPRHFNISSNSKQWHCDHCGSDFFSINIFTLKKVELKVKAPPYILSANNSLAADMPIAAVLP